MKQREYRIGPGAVSLLLVIVVVSMSVLGLLSMISARGDYKLTQRAVALAVAEHGASAAAERTLAALDELLADCAARSEDDAQYLQLVADSLPEGVTYNEGILAWEQESEDGRTLQCAVRIHPLSEGVRYSWYRHTFIASAYESENE